MVDHQKVKIAFFGTPELTVEILDELVSSSYTPSLVVTGPDVPVGRKFTLTAPAPKTWAHTHNIRCVQPEKITPELVAELASEPWDLFIVVAYGKILPEDLIRIPKFGTLNIHYSLLPKYRGATPVESAILNGETETGVSIQKMVYELDAGPLIATEQTSINPNETARELRARLNSIGKKLLVKTLPEYLRGTLIPSEQNPVDATKCGKIKKEDGEILLTDDPVILYRKYRAYFGWPGIYFFTERDGKKIRVKVTQASYEAHTFKILRVIPEGKSEMPYDIFAKTITS